MKIDIGFEYPDKEKTPELVKFEKTRAAKVEDVHKLLKWLIDEHAIKMNKGIKYEKGIEYFRGIDFHMAILQNKEKVLTLIPNFIKEGLIEKLDTLEDSILLG